MRIRTFCKFLEVSELEPLILQNCTVVVDGMNYFHRTYENSGLSSRLGCEGPRYASYLRQQLAMFQKANIKCYFIFKGGHKNTSNRQENIRDSKVTVTCPVFMKYVYKEVLDEMGFEYVNCEYECKKDIIELAEKLDCPIISYDIEYLFSGPRYIPRNELQYNETDKAIHCRYVTLDRFLKKHKLTAEKMALFIALTDEHIFPENFFASFFQRIRAPPNFFHRNKTLLHWLSKNDKETILRIISPMVSVEEKEKFVLEVEKSEAMIGRCEKGRLGAAYLLDRGVAAITPGDPDWFAKGVASNRIPINYIDLYRSGTFMGYIDDGTDPLIMCLEIVKYAHDLFTDFKNDGFKVVYKQGGIEPLLVTEMYSIRKPEYDAKVCVFENGWDGLSERRLLQHFLKETLGLEEFAALEKLPEDARLFVLALAFFSRNKADTSAEVACALLSYVTFSVVLERSDQILPKFPFASKPILDSTTDLSSVTADDCSIAAAILTEYVTPDDQEIMSDQEMLSVRELLECLRQLNDLNVLCGAPFKSTACSRMLSGGLMYRLRRAAGPGDPQQFLDKLLAPAPTVYAFLNGLIEVYESL